MKQTYFKKRIKDIDFKSGRKRVNGVNIHTSVSGEPVAVTNNEPVNSGSVAAAGSFLKAVEVFNGFLDSVKEAVKQYSKE